MDGEGASLGLERNEGTDRETVARFQAGEKDAFEDLVRRYEGPLYRLARRLLGNREDAMDAVQESFLRIYRGLDRFRGDASFGTWSYGIALNVCRSKLSSAAARRQRVTDSLSIHSEREDALPFDPPDRSPGPEAGATGRELGHLVEQALSEISPQHREVLVLREIEGMDYGEIAAVLHCAVGTVKSKLARARRAFRRTLEGTWP